MDLLKEQIRHSCQSQLARYQFDEGFSDEDKEPNVVINRNEQMYQSSNLLMPVRTKPRFHEPKAKLKFIANEQSNRTRLHHSIADRQLNNRSSVTKSMQIRKKQKNITNNPIQPIIKSKRTLIGENFTLPGYALQDYKSLKQSLSSEGYTIQFEAAKQINTHGLIKKLTAPSMKSGKNFLNSKYNSLLKQRIKQSFIAPKRRYEEQRTPTGVKFNNQIQNGNLQLAVKVKDNQYDLYLRIDTNTHGHQNWFHFQVTNHENLNQNFTFNVCNMKRQFRLIQKGQKIFMKQNSKDGKWEPAGTNICISQNYNAKIAHGRVFKLTFNLNLKQNAKYTIATLPVYTYSQMLVLLDQLEQKYNHLIDIGILNYSLCGMAIPIVNITNKQTKAEGKKVILVSGRVHPGQSVASYVIEGLMRKLLDDSNPSVSQMLKTTIFKIIPILNPDGVVFGNFRTNYLGVDLNRSFHSEDQILHPQICSLKNLGRQLKSHHGNNFIYFLDLHGHSSEKNIFTYGPNFQYNDPNFYIARLLPKILSMKSKYFKYPSCSFKLEEHKMYTARGFFLNQLNIMTYTIESSYCLYDDQDGMTKLMKVQDWLNFGMQLAEALQTAFRIKEANSIRSNRQLRNILNANEAEEALIKKIKSDIKKEIKAKSKQQENKKNDKKQKQKSLKGAKDIDDTDGQSEEQDLNEQERKQIEKKIIQFSIPSFSLPRVLKPVILYPTVTPRLFEVNEQRDQSFKVLYTKRNKYNTLRMMNANHLYATYLKNLDQLQKYKPSARNIKLQKKLEI